MGGVKLKAKLLKAAGIIGALTLVSRILGMTRDILSAQGFGTTWQWDAFIYAFMLPNFMRRLVAEGALTSAFIPVFTEIKEKEGEAAAFHFANVIYTLLFWGLAVLLLLAETGLFFFAKFPHLSPAVRLTAELLKLFTPYLLFMALCALAAGILNSYHKFFSPALNPIILDVVWIFAVLWIATLGKTSEERLFWLSVWIFISGMIQWGVQIPFLLRTGYRPRFLFDFSHPGLRKVGQLILPAVLGFAVMQINLLVDTTMGLWIGPGANSSLWYGNRIMQFPLGIFAIAMGTALLPAISRHAARNEIQEANRSLSFALRSIFFIIFPSTVGLIVLRTPIVKLLFERGQFDAVSTARTAFVLLCYTFGLFAYSGQKVIVAGFYSMQDMKTPMKVGALTLFLNIILNFILMRFLREGGLALATSISGMINFAALLYLYDRKIAGFPLRELISSTSKILIASVVMGWFAYHFYGWIYPFAGGGRTVQLLTGVFSSIALSIPIYLGICFLLRVTEIHEALRWARSLATAKPAI